MKKLFSMLLLLCLCAGLLSACGGSSSPAPAEPAPAPAPDSAPAEVPAEAAEEPGFSFTQTGSVKKEKFLDDEKYAAFLSAAEKAYLIPGLNEAAIPQGMSYSPDTSLVYISFYYKLDDMPSVIAALDAASGELTAEYRLFKPDGSVFASHVGGLAVTGDTLYVSATLDNDGSYSIAALPLSELPTEGSHDITVAETVPMATSPSFLNYSQGILWVGNFYLPGEGYKLPPEMGSTTETADGESGCYILGFDMSREGALDAGSGSYPIPDYVLIAPDRIQGMTCPDSGSVLLSQSYGRQNDSAILRYSLDLNSPDSSCALGGAQIPAFLLDSSCQLDNITAMPMTEALCLGKDGEILVLFESGAMAYDGRYRTDHVWRLALAS